VLDMIPVRRQNQLKLAVLELTGQWMVEQAAATEQPAG
jgi:hypothetical protein